MSTVHNDVLLALLPSPLLGPSAWEPVGELLRDRGRDVAVLTVPAAPADPQEVLECFLDGLAPDPELVLVPHSNAGLYVPALHAERDVVGVVFVDAALPGPEPTTPMCPPALREELADLATTDGLLPPWTQWWPEEDLTPLFGSTDVRERVEAEQPRLPLSYFDATLPSPPGWDLLTACSYLAFGDTYAAECRRAGSAGWRFENLVGTHLHMLVDPTEVADAIARLAEVPAPPSVDNL